MKRLFIFIAIIFPLLANAQDAKTVFLSMPDSITPLLTSVNKADFVDFLESNMKAQVTNKFMGNSEMTHLTPDYIRIQMSEKSTWEMKLLAVNDSIKVIGIINTACAPVCDSDLQFYSSGWQLLKVADFIELPKMDNFFQTPDSTQLYEYSLSRKKAEIFLTKAEYQPEGYNISFTFTTPEYMAKEDAEKIKPFIHSPLIYKWTNGKFHSAD